jgi:hypothetical protein
MQPDEVAPVQRHDRATLAGRELQHVAVRHGAPCMPAIPHCQHVVAHPVQLEVLVRDEPRHVIMPLRARRSARQSRWRGAGRRPTRSRDPRRAGSGTHTRLRSSRAIRSSSFRVPLFWMSIAGNTRRSASFRSRTFLAEAARLRAGEGVPQCVERAFRDFLRCGLLAGGFARFRCGDCGLDRLVAITRARAVRCVRAAVVDEWPSVPRIWWITSSRTSPFDGGLESAAPTEVPTRVGPRPVPACDRRVPARRIPAAERPGTFRQPRAAPRRRRCDHSAVRGRAQSEVPRTIPGMITALILWEELRLRV